MLPLRILKPSPKKNDETRLPLPTRLRGSATGIQVRTESMPYTGRLRRRREDLRPRRLPHRRQSSSTQRPSVFIRSCFFFPKKIIKSIPNWLGPMIPRPQNWPRARFVTGLLNHWMREHGRENRRAMEKNWAVSEQKWQWFISSEFPTLVINR